MIEEWREYSKLLNTYLGPLPGLISEVDGRLHTTFNQAVASTGRLVDVEPESPGDPHPHRAGPRDPLGLRRGARLQAPLGRLLADRAAHPRPRLGRAEAARGVRARRGHPHRHGRRGTRKGSGNADDRRALGREDDQLRDRLRDLGLRALREPRDPARAGAGVHRQLPRALPARSGLHPAHDRASGARRLRHEPSRPAAGPFRRSGRGTVRRVRWASGWPSTSSCRARTPTSSRWR